MGLIDRIKERMIASRTQAEADGPSDFWSVARCDGAIDAVEVFRNLGNLLPEGSSLFLEGTSIAAEVGAFLESHESPDTSFERKDTIWPRSSTFRIPATAENLKSLTELAGNHAAPEICDHLHGYREGEAYLIWPDFPGPGCLMISTGLPQNAVTAFACAIGCELEQKQSDPAQRRG